MEKVFIVNSSQEKIWGHLMRAILRCLPLEQITLLSDNNVSALLNIKIAFFNIPVKVNVVTADVNPDEALVTFINGKGLGGLIWINQKFNFSLKSQAEKGTQVYCKVSYENMSPLLKATWIFFSPVIKGIARDTFNKLEQRLIEWA